MEGWVKRYGGLGCGSGGNEVTKMPLVSIIVPAYNNGDIIEKSLLSLVNQRYPEKEIIVVYDEGSSDNTREVLLRIRESFPDMVHVISTEHVGRSKARNLGWKSSRGEILFFADADDIYKEDYLEKAVKCLLSDSSFGGVTVTGTTLKLESNFVTNCMEVYSSIVRRLTDEGKIKPKWAWVYRREAVEKVGGFDERLSQAEDKDLYLRVMEAGYSFGFVGGVNWWHTRRGKLFPYLKKCYAAGKRRIQFLIKYRDVRCFFYSVFLFWMFLILLLLSPLFTPLLYIALGGLLAFFLYSLAITLKLGWSAAPRKAYLFLYPIYSFMTYIATAVGYTYGFFLVLKEKYGGKSIDWSLL